MNLNLFKKFIVTLPLISLLFTQCFCFFGDPQTVLSIYNHRSDSITVYYRHTFDVRDGIPEGKLNIQSGKKNSIGESGLYEPLSKSVSYLIIKDSNGTEIMNLRGPSLDAAVRLVSKKDGVSIFYRLDVY